MKLYAVMSSNYHYAGLYLLYPWEAAVKQADGWIVLER
jgi:hypothetical protein